MLSLLVLSLLSANAVEDNAAGMKAYQAKKYAEAIERFRAALSDERAEFPTTKERVAHTRARALANFNLACTLALVRKSGRVCDHDAYRSTIMDLVLASIRLDPNRLEKALTDRDLQPIRDTVAYQGLLGLSPARDADLPRLLPKVSWWTPGVGVYGSMAQLTLRGDGVALLAERGLTDDGPTPAKTTKARWAVQGRTLTLTFPAPRAPLVLEITSAGELKGADVRFVDAPSECDA